MPRYYNYAITVTLAPEYHKYTVESQYSYFKIKLMKMLHENKHVIEYKMVPELTRSFNIHFHGLLKLRSKKSARDIMETLQKDIGFTYIKDKVDKGWEQYMNKSVIVTKKELGFEKDSRVFFTDADYAQWIVQGMNQPTLKYRQDYIDNIEENIEFIDD